MNSKHETDSHFIHENKAESAMSTQTCISVGVLESATQLFSFIKPIQGQLTL